MTKRVSFAGSAVSTPALVACRIIAPSSCCWRSMRPRSPRGSLLRARTKANACSGSSRCWPPARPGRRSRPGEVQDADVHASECLDHVLEPGEVDLQVVVDPQPGQLFQRLDEQRWRPRCSAALSFSCFALTSAPSSSVCAGIVTSESRGKLSSTTLSRFLDTCMTIVTSERAPAISAVLRTRRRCLRGCPSRPAGS